MSLSAWRAALRIARRDALRAKGRSALIIAMIALPVVGVTAADVVARSSRLTPQESATRLMGGADAYLSTVRAGWRLEQAPTPDPATTLVLSQHGPKPVPTEQESARSAQPLDRLLTEALPVGARLLPVESPAGYTLTSTTAGQGRVQAWGLDLADPLARGITTLREGDWPGAPYEVAATTEFLAESGLSVGRSTTLAGTHQALRITAAVEYPGDLKAVRLVGRPGELGGLLATAENRAEQNSAGGPTDFLVSLPAGAAFGWEDVQRANTYGFTVASRAVLADPPPDGAVPLFRDTPLSGAADTDALKSSTIAATVVGMALLEIVLLAGPAFAVGARRSRRHLGLVAAGGGDRGHIRGVVLGGAVVLAGTGALAGTVLGALAVALGRPWLEVRSGARFGHFALEPLDLLGVLAIGVVTGLLAAIVPAVQAGRQPVVAALTGRAAARPPAIWIPVAGVLVAGAGTCLALFGALEGSRTRVVMLGSVIAELGLVACTPWFVSLLGRLARALPLGPRLALRDAARNRGRSAPAVAAVMAAVAGAVAVLTFQTSGDAGDRADYAAAAPSGAVVLQTQQVSPTSVTAVTAVPAGTSAASVAAAASDQAADDLRRTVERAVPGLGVRADLRDLTYGACDGRPGSFCGSVKLTVPAENACPPALGAAGPWGTVRLDVAEARRLLAEDPRCRPSTPAPQNVREVITGDANVLRNLLGVDDPAAVQALAAGRAVVLDPHFVKDGTVPLQLTRYGADGPGGNQLSTVSLPAFAVRAQVPAARAVLSPAAAEAAGLTPTTYESVWLPPHAPGAADEQRANAAVVAHGAGAKLSVERGYRSTYGDATLLGLAIAASAVAIAAAGIATGLAATDSRGDLATLAAVGAAPGIRRRLSGFQCATVAALGAVLGALAGFVPAAAVQRVENLAVRPWVDATGGIRLGTHPLVVPWPYLAALVLGLPLLAWVVAAGFTRSRVALTRRTG
ncbi:ABC transporter permease [Kitasatospora sp. NBC_00240]|uniref:FtsX-like permease family protein n=1 Tax=Kitasatospora sp. NBC_00240 TaxID=2903567 RepID=UPI00224D827C|nr:FtsX-like permease family protein [Kitasatospora sp. NBC_00240]MCX5212007.1 ABC transporter permease [Kitasatospora sp. NBC_00240]